MEETKFYHALKIDNDRCVGCTHCMTKCPTGAIRFSTDFEHAVYTREKLVKQLNKQ